MSLNLTYLSLPFFLCQLSARGYTAPVLPGKKKMSCLSINV